MKKPENSHQQLQKKLFFYNMLGVFIVSILVAAAAIIPLYDALFEHEHQNLKFSHKLQSGRTGQYFSTIRGIADQITSRSRIRQELEKYNAGDISLETFQTFTRPKLHDALDHSPEVKGISRYDQNGNYLLSVGLNHDHFEKNDLSWQRGITSTSGPIFIDSIPYFLVITPIKNRNDIIVGKDEVLFNIDGLRQISQQQSLERSDSYLLLAYKNNGNYLWLNLQNDSKIMPPIREDLRKILNNIDVHETRITTIEDSLFGIEKPVVTYGLLGKKYDYPLLIISGSEGIYAHVVMTILKVCGVILILLIFSGIILFILLSPLEKKAIDYQKGLESEVKALKGIIPICSYCKEIRDDTGYWNRLEEYIESHSEAQFSHGICEKCLSEHFGDRV